MPDLIVLKDCTITEIEYECHIHGGCPTCGCGGDTIADLTFYTDYKDERGYVSITNTEDDCTARSNNVFQEIDCIRILGVTNVDFRELTLVQFVTWFCSHLQKYIKVGEILVEFEYPTEELGNALVFTYSQSERNLVKV